MSVRVRVDPIAALFHVSEDRSIEQFDPRVPEDGRDAIVWAIDADRLRNYLVPRDCPRVTYYAGRRTTAADMERFLGSSPAVMAIELGRTSAVHAALLLPHAPADVRMSR